MLKLSTPSIGREECQAVEKVLLSGQLVQGRECEEFEQELASYLGVREVVLVSSATAALHLSLLALGIGPGDAVIVPDFTFPATVNVVELVGATPIIVDVDIETYNISLTCINEVIEKWQGKEKIRAIIPVHEFGCPVDMRSLMALAQKNNLLVIEDAACGLGAFHATKKVGTFGQVGCFSFHPRKAITTGEGGAIATNDTVIAESLRIARNHGILKKGTNADFVVPGYNYRMTDFQAALGRVQLKKFDCWLSIRRELQETYRKQLAFSEVVLPKEVEGHAWQTFMVILPEYIERAKLIFSLREYGIETNFGAQSIHCLSFYKNKYVQMCENLKGNNAERLYYQGLALPLCQSYTEDDIALVVNSLRTLIEKWEG